MGRYLIYFDVVGTGYYARKDLAKYASMLSFLRNKIQASALLSLRTGDEVIFLHSNGFAASRDLSRLCRFAELLRASLLTQCYFLKAVIGSGEFPLHPQAFKPISTGKSVAPQANKNPETGPSMQGFMFGAESALVFGQHYRFSGIGIRVLDLTKTEEKLITDKIVHSYFIHTRSKKIESFTDLKYGEDELSSFSLSNICLEYVRLRARFRGVGSHFVPLFISIIRSVDWTALKEVDDADSGDSKVDLAKALYERLTGHWYVRHFNDVPSRELILFALLHGLFHGTGGESSRFRTAASLCGSDWYLKKLEEVPESILDSEARGGFVEFISNVHKRPKNRTS